MKKTKVKKIKIPISKMMILNKAKRQSKNQLDQEQRAILVLVRFLDCSGLLTILWIALIAETKREEEKLGH